MDDARTTDDVTRAAEEHHAELWAELTARGGAVIEAAARAVGPVDPGGPAGSTDDVANPTDVERASLALLGYLDDEVVPHIEAEERMVYSLARGAGERGLVAALELDHRALLRQVEALRNAPAPLDAALAARTLLLLFALRMEKEEKVLLPLLAERGIDIGVLVDGRPEIVGA